MRGGIEQALGFELPMDFQQRIADLAEQSRADRLVVDEGAAATIGGNGTAQEKHIAALYLSVFENFMGLVFFADVEFGGDAGLVFAFADQAAFRARAES